MEPYRHVLAFALEHPWAVTPEMRLTIADILARRLTLGAPTRAEIEAALPKRERLPQPASGGGLAIIPVHGVIVPRADLMTDLSGAVSLERLAKQVRAAVADPSVDTLLLDINSPGGNVAGLTEFVGEVMRPARAKKPIVAVANHLAGSAAFSIGANSTKFFASPSANVGSVGVYAMHDDISELLQREGVKREYFAVPDDKVMGAPSLPLTDGWREHMRARVDREYDVLTQDIALGRGISVARVRDGYGQGRIVSAAEALDLKMIDRVASMDATLARYTKTPHAAAAAAALLTDDEDDDTRQEPTHAAAATRQDRVPEYVWATAIERALVEWQC